MIDERDAPDPVTRGKTLIAEIVEVTVGCSLDPDGVFERAETWLSLRERCLVRAELISGGARMVLDAHARPAIADLVAREASCCPHLTIEVFDGDPLVVDITGAAEAQRMIRALAGLR